MTREQIYKEQLQALGIYDPAFDPEIKTLAQLEDKILAHREALGLTPKSLRKLKGAYYETVRGDALTQGMDPENVTVLDLVREKFAL